MTRVVVFDQELSEALTVVELPIGVLKAAEEGRIREWVVPLPGEWDFAHFSSLETAATRIDRHDVRLRLEAIVTTGDRRGELRTLFWIACADNPELALRLRAAFLPGQLGEVQRQKQEAFWLGAFAGAMVR